MLQHARQPRQKDLRKLVVFGPVAQPELDGDPAEQRELRGLAREVLGEGVEVPGLEEALVVVPWQVLHELNV